MKQATPARRPRPGRDRSAGRDENGCSEPALVMVLLVVGLIGAWLFLRGKVGAAGYVPPPPPPPHEVAAHHAADLLLFMPCFAALVFPVLALVLSWAVRGITGRSVPVGAGLRTPAEYLVICAGPAAAVGALLGGTACVFLGPWIGPGTDMTAMISPVLPWETAGALVAVAVTVAFLRRGGLWDGPAYTGSTSWGDRSWTRTVAREHRLSLTSAVRWSGAFDRLHRTELDDPDTAARLGDLTEWDALVGDDAAVWAAAGFTLDDAAWLAALPPWHPNRPTPDTLARTGRLRREQDKQEQRDLDATRLSTLGVLAAGPDGQERCAAYRAHGYSPDNDRCVAGVRCPSHDPAFLKALTAEVTW